MARRDSFIEHLLRRAGFGASPAEMEYYAELGYPATVELLLSPEQVTDTVDDKIGTPGYVGVTTRGQFLPHQNVADARQRWLFRMVHTERPLQEKMALYWHHHFATAYTKIAGVVGAVEATRMLAAKTGEDAGGVKGQIETIRDYALGNFRDFLVEMARDVAMNVWLDGRTNTRARPQENFAREVMELFTMGIGNYTEADVYAGARVFTGWNMRRVGATGDPATKYEFFYNSAQHDTTAKTFTFPIYADGGTTIPARAAASGMQDGLDFIDAVVRHPATGRRLARRFWAFFVSEISEPPSSWVEAVAAAYYSTNYNIKAMLRVVFHSHEFLAIEHRFARYAWPVEFVVRAIKETGWTGFSVNDTLTPLINMGQQLFEPPDVNGWETGPGWFSTGGSLARLNFAAQLATNQRFNLRNDARGQASTPQALLSYALDRWSPMEYERGPYEELLTYLRAGGNWTGSDAQLLTKVPGLVHLMLGSSEYQFA